MSKRLIVPAVIVLVVALTAIGCGSSGDNSSSTGDGSTSSSASGGGDELLPISKAAFIKGADAACASGKKQVEGEYAVYLKKKGIKEISSKVSSNAEAEAQATEVIETIAIPALNEQLDTIKALGVPDGEEKVSAYLSAVEEGIEEGEAEPLTLFTSTEKVFAKADKLAGEIGLKVCGQR